MPGTWVSLVTANQVGRVTRFFQSTIEASFVSHPMRHMTSAEVKRRFEIVASIFEKLRGDLKWGIDKIEEHLPHYFGDDLDGRPWKPSERSFWIPEGGAGVPMERDGGPIEAASEREAEGILRAEES